MKTQIHELRIRIDGLAQLVKSMDRPVLMISRDNIPPDMTIEDIANEFEKCGNIISVSTTPQIEYKGGLSFLAETYKSLLLAKAWFGEVLAELGEETPYKNDGNRKTVEDIEPTADRSTLTEVYYNMNAQFNVKTLFDDKNNAIGESSRSYIEKIDWLREEIKKVLSSTDNLFDPEDEVDDWPGDECYKAIDHLTEARFFLGFELSRIKEQSK